MPPSSLKTPPVARLLSFPYDIEFFLCNFEAQLVAAAPCFCHKLGKKEAGLGD